MLNSLRRYFRRQTICAAAVALALAAVFAALARLGDLSTFVVEAIALALAAGILYFLGLYCLHRTEERRATVWLVLAAALGFRLLLFPLAPSLSDDLHRYRWDARVQLADLNPYEVRPDDAWLASLRQEFRDRGEAIPGGEVGTIYGPLSEHVFRITYRYLPGAVGFKLPMLLADLTVGALLAGWVLYSGGRAVQLAIYAWNPLVVVEFAAGGHNDALALAAVVAATLVIIRRRPVMSTLLLTAAALVKYFAAVLAPVWLAQADWPRRGRAWVAAGAAGGLAAVCWWPFRGAEAALLENLSYFATRWPHNNASLYSLLAWLTGSSAAAKGVGAGAVAGLALWAAARRLDPVRAALLLFGAVLLFSPVAFPWYFTWVVPFVALLGPVRWAMPWLLLTVTQFVSYHVLIDYSASGAWQFQSGLLWLAYGPFYAWLLVTLARRQDESEGRQE
jgi:hypothetical protein